VDDNTASTYGDAIAEVYDGWHAQGRGPSTRRPWRRWSSWPPAVRAIDRHVDVVSEGRWTLVDPAGGEPSAADSRNR